MAPINHLKYRLRASMVIAVTVLAVMSMSGNARAQDPVAEFYKGKVVTLVVTTASGTGYDYGARVLARHFGRHIPGNPTVVVQNRPGGGGRTGTAHVYSVAPRDGTIIGAVQSFIATDPLFDPSIMGLFDPRQFNWLGSIASTTSLAVGWRTAAAKTYDDLFEKELIVGGVGAATPMVTMPYLFRRLLGMKFKVVAGYQSGNEVNLAMERGEVQGRIDYSWHSLGAEHLDWIKDKKINLLFQMGLQKHKDLGHVPLIIDLARDEEQRRILEVMFFNYEFGRAFVLAPGTPPERIAALRKAFVDTMADAEFLKDAAASNLEVNPVTAERLQALVDQAYKLPPDLVARTIALQKPDDK
jgi:tripartite-type tricarboxylate transporter receptor subunit TctC